MKSSIERKVDRFVYYLRNITRDSAPQIIFRKRLNTILKNADRYDAVYLSSRLQYYNKLSDRSPTEPYSSTVGSIPMTKSYYYYDLKEHARYFPRDLRLSHVFGDVTKIPDRPSVVKSRPIAGDNQNSVVMKLVKFRHFYFPTDRLPFLEKKPIAVWRGGQHNKMRLDLVRRYHGHHLCDVGCTAGRDKDVPRSGFLRPAEQMAFKYVLSVEGNDTTTNLKWAMASNSLCIMPQPKYETWFMEGRLEAGKHFVKVRDDFTDLEETLLYYERHSDEALEIIRNANDHATQFFDKSRERLISLLVLAKYFALTGQFEPDRNVSELIFPANPGLRSGPTSPTV